MAMVVDHGLPMMVDHCVPPYFGPACLLKCVGMYMCCTLHTYSDHMYLVNYCMFIVVLIRYTVCKERIIELIIF